MSKIIVMSPEIDAAPVPFNPAFSLRLDESGSYVVPQNQLEPGPDPFALQAQLTVPNEIQSHCSLKLIMDNKSMAGIHIVIM